MSAGPPTRGGLAAFWKQLRQHAAQVAAALAALTIAGTLLLGQTRPPPPTRGAPSTSPSPKAASASAVVLDVLHIVVTGGTEDDQTLDEAIVSAAAEHNVPLANGTRSELTSLFQQLRSVDYELYSRGYVITQLGPDEVRLVQESGV